MPEDKLFSGRRSSGIYSNSTVTTLGVYALCNFDTISSVNFSKCTTISQYALSACTKIQTAIFPSCVTIGSYAFWNDSKLTTISFPKCKTISTDAFRGCSGLTSIYFPLVTTIWGTAFASCNGLTTIQSTDLPVCSSIPNQAFYKCTGLLTVTMPALSNIYTAFQLCDHISMISFPKGSMVGSSAFSGCVRLTKLYLTNSSVAKLSNSNAFTSTPIGGYSTTAGTFGSIYVPSSLLTSYKASTNWTYFSSRFVSV